MKILKHPIVIATLALTLVISVVLAATWIYSNTVTVSVTKRTFTLSANPMSIVQYENVTLTATLNPASAGKTIYFFKNNGTKYQIGTNLTNPSGIATLKYLVTDNVTSINFTAGEIVA